MKDKSKTGVIECIFHNPTITLKHRYLGDKVMAATRIVICHFTRQKLCRAANIPLDNMSVELARASHCLGLYPSWVFICCEYYMV
jgi:hypothetical protein